MDIQIELEELGAVKRKLSIEIPTETAASEFDRVARDFMKHANLPGFRRGKAPLQLIKRRFEGDIRGEVIQKLVPESYEQAIKEKDLKPLGQPSLENLAAKEGEPLMFDALIEVKPEITLPKYKGLSVKVESEPVTDEAVEQELEQLREKRSAGFCRESSGSGRRFRDCQPAGRLSGRRVAGKYRTHFRG